jgi:pimeloyl-ACP methyl ester carboxylesterase
MLAWKWDPLLRARSPLPIVEDVVQLLIGQVTAPLLAIRGENGMLPPEPELRARFPQLRMTVHTIAAGGHHLHLDAPEQVASLIAKR